MTQHTLFGDLAGAASPETIPDHGSYPGKELHRRSDPETSKLAAVDLASSGQRERMAEIALGLVEANPGRTAAELEALSGLTDGKVRKRLNDLWHKGRIEKGEARKCSVTGKSAQTWWAENSQTASAVQGT